MVKYYAVLAAFFVGCAQAEQNSTIPEGWWFAGTPGSDYTIEVADSPYGSKCALIYSANESRTTFGGLGQAISALSFVGKSVQVAATMKTEDLMGWAGLWVRIDAADGRLISLDNMSNRPLFGSTGWQTKRIVLAVPEGAVRIAFGVIQNGAGHTWVDEFDVGIAPSTVQPTMPPSRIIYFNEPVCVDPPKIAANLDFEL